MGGEHHAPDGAAPSGSICSLYNWRYKVLGDLPHVQQRAEYQRANAGFCFDYQVVNVDDFNGVGESEPSPYFFQVSRQGGGAVGEGAGQKNCWGERWWTVVSDWNIRSGELSSSRHL